MGDCKLGYGILGVKKGGIWEIGGKTSWDMGDLVPCVTPLTLAFARVMVAFSDRCLQMRAMS